MYPSEMGNLQLMLFLTKHVKDINYVCSITQEVYKAIPTQEELLIDAGRDFISMKPGPHHNNYMICQHTGTDGERWAYLETVEQHHTFDIISAIRLANTFAHDRNADEIFKDSDLPDSLQ